MQIPPPAWLSAARRTIVGDFTAVAGERVYWLTRKQKLDASAIRVHDREMASYLLLIALIAGLLMYLLSTNGKVVRIGEMLLFSSILALLIALAPATVRLLHG